MRLRIVELPTARQEDWKPIPGTTPPWMLVLDRMSAEEVYAVSTTGQASLRSAVLELGGAGALCFGPGLSVDIPDVDDPDLP